MFKFARGVTLLSFERSKASVVFLLFLVKIAFVVASCSTTVFRPWAHADPAEMMFTGRAGHMVAALVLLDVAFASGTGLRVGQDPLRILALGTLFLNPKLG